MIRELADQGQLTVRIAYNLFTQKPKEELADFKNWTGSVKYGQGSDFFRHNGAGEMLVFSAADFEDFLEPRPDLPQTMEQELEPVVRHLVEQRWPFRLHATYDESISRMLDVFEKVDRDIPFNGLPWFFDHAETITPRNIERVRALGGGIAIQDRMAFQGEYFVDRYGAKAAEATPPISACSPRACRWVPAPTPPGSPATTLDLAVLAGQRPHRRRHGPVSAGPAAETALQLFTHGSAWFSSEQGKKGQIKVGQLADLAALSADFFSVEEEAIKWIESVLTVVDSKIVYAAAEFGQARSAGAAGAAGLVAGGQGTRPLAARRAVDRPGPPVRRCLRGTRHEHNRAPLQRTGERLQGFWAHSAVPASLSDNSGRALRGPPARKFS